MRSKFVITFGIMFFSLWTIAQIQVTLTIPQLGSPYLSDYISNQSSRILIVSNTSAERRHIYLHGRLEQLSRPGYYMRTRQNYRPNMSLTLEPFETKTLFSTAGDFSFFDLNNLEDNVPADIKRRIQLNGILPEGDYKICVEAFDFFTNRPVSLPDPSGCQFFNITLGSPPQLVNPICMDTLQSLFPMFMWTPAISTVPLGVIGYTLYIVEYNSRALNPQEMMEQSINYNAGNPIVIRQILTNSYPYSPTDIPLKPGKTYIACVVARDVRGNAVFENQGRSEICMFYTGKQSVIKNNTGGPTIIQPNSNIVRPPIVFATTAVKGRLKHRFKYEQYDHVATAESQNNGLNININGIKNINNDGGQGTTDSNSNATKSNTSKFEGLTAGSQPFPIVGQNRPDLVVGNGFSSFSHLVTTATQLVAGKKIKMLFDENEYNTKSQDLKNTEVSLIEQYLLVRNLGSDISDYSILSGLDRMTPMPDNVTSFAERKIATTRTDNLGRFQFNVPLNRPYGLLSDGSVNIQFLGFNTEGRALLRVLRVVVDDDRYYSPNVIIMPEAGDNIDIGVQACLVKTYSIEIAVLAGSNDLMEKNAEHFGKPVPVKAHVLRENKVLGKLDPSHPTTEPIYGNGAIKDLSDYGSFLTKNAPAKTLYECESDAQGKIRVNNLIAHRHHFEEYWLSMETRLDDEYHYKNDLIFFACGALSEYGQKYFGDPKNVNSAFFNGRFNHQFKENVVLKKTVHLQPKYPAIYFQAEEVYTQYREQNLPDPVVSKNAKVLIKYPDHPQWGETTGFTDSNGKFRMQYSSMYGQPNGFDAQVQVSKYGFRPYNSESRNMEMGEQFTPTDVILRPLSRVRMEVENEVGKPTKSYVQIGENYLAETYEMDCSLGQGSNASNRTENVSFDIPAIGWTQGVRSSSRDNQILILDRIDTLTSLSLTNALKKMDTSPRLFLNRTLVQNILTGKTCKQVMEVTAPAINNLAISVDPLSTQYDKFDTLVNLPLLQILDLGVITVKFRRKKAKININCLEAPSLCTAANALVRFHEFEQVIQGLPGEANFQFQNQGNQYRVRINAGPDFVPIDENVILQDFNLKEFNYTLKKAIKLRGTVLDTITGLPIDKVRVFAIIGVNSHGNQYVETYTNSNGFFELGGLPTHIEHIHFSKSDNSITYIGKKIRVQDLVSNIAQPRVYLMPLEGWDVSSLLGFPVELTTVESVSDTRLRVSGNVTRLPSNANFRTLSDDVILLPFEGLLIEKFNESAPDGRAKALVVGAQIPLLTNKAYVRVNRSFNGIIHGTSSRPGEISYSTSSAKNRLHIFKTGDFNGSMVAIPEILTNSFAFSNDFQGRFFLSDQGEDVRVEVFKSQISNVLASSLIPAKDYYVGSRNCNAFGQCADFILRNPQFSFEGFKANADKMSSRLRKDTIILSTTIRLEGIVGVEPNYLDINIGDILVFKDDIQAQFRSRNKISFKIDKWTLESTNWSFDQANSSISLIRPSLITPSLTVKLGNIHLQNHQELMLVSDINVLSGQPKLANVADMNFYDDTYATIRYMNPLHEASKKMYQLLIGRPNGGAVSYVNLAPYLDGGNLDISEFRLYSDGFERVVLKDDMVNFYNIYPVSRPAIVGYNNYFHLTGNSSLSIPSAETSNSTTLKFYRENNALKMELVNNAMAIHNMKGHLSFVADASNKDTRILSNNNYQAIGTITVYESAGSNSKVLMRLRAKLIHRRVNGTLNTHIETFDVISDNNNLPGSQPQKIFLDGQINTNNSYLVLEEGAMLVVGNEWDYMRFKAAFGGQRAQEGFDLNKKSVWYTIHGDITADAQNIGVNNVNVPSEQGLVFDIRFDFKKNALIGNFNLPAIPGGLALGPMIVYGDISGGFKFSPEGFYFCSSVDEAMIAPIPIYFSSFLLVGSTPVSNIEAEHRALLFNKVWKDFNSFPSCLNQINGVFMGANMTVVDFNIGLDIVIVSMNLDVFVATDIYSYFTFGSQTIDVGYGLKVKARVIVEGRLLFCSFCMGVEFGVGVHADAQVNVAGVINSAVGFDISGLLENVNFRAVGYGEASLAGSFCSVVRFRETLRMEVILSMREGLSVGLGKSSNSSQTCIPTSRKYPMCGS